MLMETKKLTWNQWLDIVHEIKDLSHELPDTFLVYGQFMRAKIEWKGKIWLAKGWNIGSRIVDLKQIEE